ncbi:unnamed protein product [Didymodactylos carnosus]|uniref:G-protein coupled receptors family 1 profile domain-containing protein n=1 Tax=Didymodactylos carnosus TaxID=1234261 RepID=A0A8S2UZ56_9BILA|nr:unnamed protein product [Didymodactylos carnosus]CAF4362773.1 unnamed protein product [Didymodactylos carnosus]
MRKSSTNLYILALSFVNIIVLIVFILSHGLRWIFYNSCSNIITSYELFYIKIFLYIYPIHITSVLTSIYLATSVTIDRFLIICLPYRMKKYHSKKSSLIVIISVCSFCIIYCLPFWFEFTHEEEKIESSKSNVTYLTLVLSNFGKKPLFRLLMRKYFYIIFVFLLPLIILIFCKTCIIRRLMAIHKTRRLLGAQHRSNNAITLLLLSIVAIFLFTQFPYFLFNILYALNGPQYMETSNARLYLSVNNVLCVINASSVFLLYSFFGQKFRHILRAVFHYKRTTSDSGHSKRLHTKD